MQAMEISRTGLDVEWRRLEVIAQNLAAANSSAAPGTSPYQAMRLVSGPRFSDHLGGQDKRVLSGVRVYGIEPMGLAGRRVHEPGNPNADVDGYVTYPAVDHAAEMTLMVTTSRAYEANVVAMNTARQMYMKALELGRGA
jgi:flagellar basal-body rod protein FlgC